MSSRVVVMARIEFPASNGYMISIRSGKGAPFEVSAIRNGRSFDFGDGITVADMDDWIEVASLVGIILGEK